MKYKATVHIMPRREILDPQGKATQLGLHNLGFQHVDGVRIGKRIELEVEAATQEEARSIAEEASRKLLVNTIIEQFHLELEPA
ncbi:MAG: phosphoribosylformylglycinamidine synthase subunit PurS [Bacteroidia bacterium]|nr:phosphoribosylformylglycinamidine synthase subunit PurS [Bacteroidia bacterium]